MKWTYRAGLFVTAADVLIALGITNSSSPVDEVLENSRYSGGDG